MLILWLALSFGVAALCTSKKLGFAGGLVISLMLSPVVGFICYLCSKDVKKVNEIEQLRKEIEELKKK